ncbi:hypothetical protein TrRE_jg3371 [Triparma retinervis]|uniref:Uncharacterized protein n=1 Tax=Triparma retinervis TaxID=2557542 RepID=A0A9W7AQD3_9STRA|nr:hypothetical protein TrRE_jg3371 [Triparma retinervis]
MPTASTAIAAHVAGTVFLLLSHTALVLQIKSSRILDAKISIRAAAVVLAGSCVSHIQFFRSASTFEGLIISLSRAFGLGEHTSFTSPVEEGKTVVTYLARFSQAVSENAQLFDFATLVAMVSCCFYILHSALIKTIGNSAVGEGSSSSSASSSSSSSAPAPGTSAMDGFVKLSCLLLAISSYIVASDDQVVQAGMLGRTLVLYGHYEQVKLLKSSSPLTLMLSGVFLAVSSASILTSLQTEVTGYSPSNIITYVSKVSPVELHFYAIMFLKTALSTFYTTNALGSSKSSLSLPVLALLYTGLVFFGPSGFGWIYHKWRIDTKIFQVYTYFAFTMNLVPTLFLCGAPGLIVVLGLCNGLASFHGVDLNSHFTAR